MGSRRWRDDASGQDDGISPQSKIVPFTAVRAPINQHHSMSCALSPPRAGQSPDGLAVEQVLAQWYIHTVAWLRRGVEGGSQEARFRSSNARGCNAPAPWARTHQLLENSSTTYWWSKATVCALVGPGEVSLPGPGGRRYWDPGSRAAIMKSAAKRPNRGSDHLRSRTNSSYSSADVHAHMTSAA